ncbi:inositol monophosphatase family protein [Dactylosporangium matsuzakiense]|uniref:Fructose 1,6-bisphosphatase n=1 Tax=Dactylosporangium matsuzakiense TaxID=53360 RepID=A0A9W6NIU3_9ACTN|nr:inositol monophosphatase family protein [Dactylosporangium matsuzakiense]GLK99199.1 fructose 1,6-bisphosphatase [Dactylosporangium matsuzakiense]
MKDLLTGTAAAVRSALQTQVRRRRTVHGDSPGGDAQFDIDKVAEKAVWEHVWRHAPVPVAVYTEDEGLRTTGPRPEHVLVVDPIDGTRPASAGLEMATVSVAAARMGEGRPTVGDVVAAHVLEIKSGAWFYADARSGLHTGGHDRPVPDLSPNTDLTRMFWSMELNGHPMRLMCDAYGHLVDASANTGGIFVFNSASYSITRIITGQLDAFVDVGNRILRDRPETEIAFRRVGRGSVLHLFGYDIAASVFLARRAGVVITDAYGDSLDTMPLLALDPASQRSCVAASTPQLHAALLQSIIWNPVSGGTP